MSNFEVFRRGQIFPRRLRKGVTSLRKAQHILTFACDAVYSEGIFYTYSVDLPLVSISGFSRKRKNSTRQKFTVIFNNISIKTSSEPWNNFVPDNLAENEFKLFGFED
ncbi:MAG: hypothetical protein EOO06_00880 [Chitinophagaceae bacterium]|nr:MAG: hypothetical protein EOO06_00880 [Chitinophagaceae bacterium]